VKSAATRTGSEPRGTDVAAGGKEPAAVPERIGSVLPPHRGAAFAMAKAITPTAYKLARIIYAMLKPGRRTWPRDWKRTRPPTASDCLWNLKRKAGALGYELSFGGQGESRSCIGILSMIYAEPQSA
jgi:hypothetical protein